jgi:hypothetical protein
MVCEWGHKDLYWFGLWRVIPFQFMLLVLFALVCSGVIQTGERGSLVPSLFGMCTCVSEPSLAGGRRRTVRETSIRVE